MSDLLHPAQRWLNIGLLLLKVVSVAFIVASFLYLIVAGLNFSVLGAIRVDTEHHGTSLIVGCMLVLFALCLVSGALGLRAAYDPGRVRVFLLAAVVTLAVLVVQTASSFFGVEDSAFGVGFIGGMNRLLCGIAGASAVLAISIDRTARWDSATGSDAGNTDSDTGAGNADGVLVEPVGDAGAEHGESRPDAAPESGVEESGDGPSDFEMAHADLPAHEMDVEAPLADDADSGAEDAEEGLADDLGSEDEDAESDADVTADDRAEDANGYEGEESGRGSGHPAEANAVDDALDGEPGSVPESEELPEADGVSGPEADAGPEAVDESEADTAAEQAVAEPEGERDDGSEADAPASESTAGHRQISEGEDRGEPTVIAAIGRSPVEPEGGEHASESPSPHAVSSGDFLFQGFTANPDTAAPPRAELPDFKPLEVDPLLFDDDFEARFRNAPVFKDSDDAPLFGDGDASEATDEASAIEGASEPRSRGRHYR